MFPILEALAETLGPRVIALLESRFALRALEFIGGTPRSYLKEVPAGFRTVERTIEESIQATATSGRFHPVGTPLFRTDGTPIMRTRTQFTGIFDQVPLTKSKLTYTVRGSSPYNALKTTIKRSGNRNIRKALLSPGGSLLDVPVNTAKGTLFILKKISEQGVTAKYGRAALLRSPTQVQSIYNKSAGFVNSYNAYKALHKPTSTAGKFALGVGKGVTNQFASSFVFNAIHRGHLLGETVGSSNIIRNLYNASTITGSAKSPFMKTEYIARLLRAGGAPKFIMTAKAIPRHPRGFSAGVVAVAKRSIGPEGLGKMTGIVVTHEILKHHGQDARNREVFRRRNASKKRRKGVRKGKKAYKATIKKRKHTGKGGTIHVKGYTRRDGTIVEAYTRSA